MAFLVAFLMGAINGFLMGLYAVVLAENSLEEIQTATANLTSCQHS